LLTPRTIQAHCTYLSPEELSRLAQHGTAIAHCPLSNAYFSARQFPLREALDRGVCVGLGTDIAGGYSIDILGAMRWAVGVARILEGARLEKSGGQAAGPEDQANGSIGSRGFGVDWKEALYLGTRGGAVALGLGSGVFKIGAPFDAQLSKRPLFCTLTLCNHMVTFPLSVRLFDPRTTSEGTGPLTAPLDFFDLSHESLALNLTPETVEKWWCLGDRRNRAGMWIQGRRILFG
jgi:guanine deaminase